MTPKTMGINNVIKFQDHFLVVAGIRSWGGSVSWDWCWGRGSSIGGLDLSGEDSFTLILDIRDKAILISSVGHNLGAGVREVDTVRSTGPVSITALRVSKVVGVGVLDSILKVVLGSCVSIDLNWNWSIGRSRCWGIRWSRCWGVACALRHGNGHSGNSREGKDLEWITGI